MLMSHACLTAILARKKPWEPPEPPAWKQPHEFKVGCVALSAATAVLNSGPPVTSTKSPVRARRAHGGFSGSPRPDSGAHAAGAFWPWAADSVSENLGFAYRSLTFESRGETHM